MVYQQSPIGQTRQAIVKGIMKQSFLRLFAAVDILNLEDEMYGIAAFNLGSRSTPQYRDEISGFMDVPILRLEIWHQTIEQLVDYSYRGANVLWMD
jgi:hypothetical protein